LFPSKKPTVIPQSAQHGSQEVLLFSAENDSGRVHRSVLIADSMLEELPAPSSVGKTKVGGIDLNRARMRWVVETLVALGGSPSAQGFKASELARQVLLLSNQSESDYGPRRAAYDLKKPIRTAMQSVFNELGLAA
jgi:hypothetical protein